MNRNATYRGVSDVIKKLSEVQLLAIQDNEVAFIEYMDGFVLELAKGIFVFPLHDKDALPHEKDFVAAMRARAEERHPDYQGPHLWEVKAGLNFRVHGLKLGLPLYEDWKYLQDWELRNDQDTEACRLLWTPRLVPDSMGKTSQEMMDVLDEEYRKYGLPELNRSRPFGSVSQGTGLIAAHWKRTSGRERVPFSFKYATTDTLDSNGRRLFLGYFDEHGLCCVWIGHRDDDVGCFPQVVLPLAA